MNKHEQTTWKCNNCGHVNSIMDELCTDCNERNSRNMTAEEVVKKFKNTKLVDGHVVICSIPK